MLSILSIQAVSAQDQKIESEQIIVRIFETGALSPSMILVSYGDDNIESIDLKNISKTKNWIHNLNLLHTVFDRIRKQGYTLTHNNAAGPGAMLTTTYILLRNDLSGGGRERRLSRVSIPPALLDTQLDVI